MKHLDRVWENYRALMLNTAASPAFVESHRRAFMSGAALLFKVVYLMLDEDKEPTDKDLVFMAQLQAELDSFGQELDATVLGQLFASLPRGTG